ncbi:DUF721 domain-containing protein [Patescibacteria group bacterium]|jgi:hypothetical protein|uniref:DUF721 domain-containing protein n=1 Tax=candidate division WWE3 bacterium TaxID=2053526 RepID=A0A928Y4H2_UNCKA|nr:DUF721 domain-containing protein [candidate division WWE3 bacterium]MCL4732184.1 DUF721 domain-containing protein [Patescibacteria group bacterium]MDL1953086.1 DUF721 domain-containing protein [Candidatus Uhrbacteria bacterium UHB]RIL00461.1 MAG: hypothetical protein DCC77_02745 [Candidatus Uhrbacteria bacterium]
MSFQPIRKILPQAIQRAGLDTEVSAVRVVETAQEQLRQLWGEERAAHVNVVSFSGGVLNIETATPSAAHVIRGMQESWINEMNRELGERKVRTIRIGRSGF